MKKKDYISKSLKYKYFELESFKGFEKKFVKLYVKYIAKYDRFLLDVGINYALSTDYDLFMTSALSEAYLRIF